MELGTLGLLTGVIAYVFVLSRRRQRAPALRPSAASQRLLSAGRKRLLLKLLDVGGFFGMDIGGTLCKLMFFLPEKELALGMLRTVWTQQNTRAQCEAKLKSVHALAGFILSRDRYGKTGVRDTHLSFSLPGMGGEFHFIRFETRRMEGALKLASRNGLAEGMHNICATGGGALKFRAAAKEILKVDLDPRDEIDCLVKGMAFLMAHVAGEAFTWEGDVPVDRPMDAGVEYPYLLANVGSGAGFILVRSEDSWERVSGTSIGGGSFYGLCHMLTGETSYDKMLDGAEQGRNERVDLTVGDIYGGDYNKFGLKAATIAASFGKALMCARQPAAAARGVPPSGSGGGGSGGGGDDAGGSRGHEDALSADGSFRAVGRRSTRRRAASELPDDGGAAKAGFAKPLLSRTWDPATLLAAVAAGEGGDGDAAEAPPALGGSGGGGSPSKAGGTAAAQAQHDGDDEAEEGEESAAASSAPYWDPSDAYRALLIMISNNLGQLAHLNALRYECKHVYFAGNFFRVENTIAMRTLSYAITFWSKGTMEALFLRHEGYCGALGAFLSTLEEAGSCAPPST